MLISSVLLCVLGDSARDGFCGGCLCSLSFPDLGELRCEAMKRCGDKKTGKQACHSTLPFESLRVLSPSAVSSGPNGKVEGLMALSRIEGLAFRFEDPCICMSELLSPSS